MKDFILSNWFVVLVIGVFIGHLIYLMITRQWIKLKQQAYMLMLNAERVYVASEGKRKFEVVFTRLYYDLIPDWLRMFVTEELIREKLQEWYTLAKDYLKS